LRHFLPPGGQDAIFEPTPFAIDTPPREIAKRKPLRAVFRDSSFADLQNRIKAGELFKTLAPDTAVKVI